MKSPYQFMVTTVLILVVLAGLHCNSSLPLMDANIRHYTILGSVRYTAIKDRLLPGSFFNGDSGITLNSYDLYSYPLDFSVSKRIGKRAEIGVGLIGGYFKYQLKCPVDYTHLNVDNLAVSYISNLHLAGIFSSGNSIEYLLYNGLLLGMPLTKCTSISHGMILGYSSNITTSTLEFAFFDDDVTELFLKARRVKLYYSLNATFLKSRYLSFINIMLPLQLHEAYSLEKKYVNESHTTTDVPYKNRLNLEIRSGVGVLF